MAVLLRELIRCYKKFINESSDPRVKNYLFMGSPWEITLVMIAYFVFVTRIGPAFMANRPPFKLKRTLQVYNIIQIICNCCIVWHSWQDGYGPNGTFSFLCEPLDRSESAKALKITRFVHYYFLLKVADMLDTVFFVLRKKNNQLTFLHIYHHAGMVFNCWIFTKFVPGGHFVLVGLINSFVHVVMYAYYFYATLNVDPQNLLKWKKHLTQLQMVQFLLLIVHMGQVLVISDCDYPTWLVLLALPQNVLMLILFVHFYWRTYILQQKPQISSTKVESVNELKLN